MDVRSITIRQHKSLRNLIEAIPEEDWTPIPYWVDGAMWPELPRVSPTPRRWAHRPAGAAHARFPTGPLRHHSYHGFITDRDGRWLEADHRRHAEIENAMQVRRGVKPSPLGALRRHWLGPPPGPLDGADRPGWFEPGPSGGGFLYHRTWGSPARHYASLCICHQRWPWEAQFSGALARQPFHSQPDDPSATGPPSGQPNVPGNSRYSPVKRAPLPVSYLAISLITATLGAPKSACRPPPNLPSAPMEPRISPL